MKRIDKEGIVHVSIEYNYAWRLYCGSTWPSGNVVHHDTVVTCIACVAKPPGQEETHRPVRKDGVIVRDKNGYCLAACLEGKRGMDSRFINDENPSCYVCRKLK